MESLISVEKIIEEAKAKGIDFGKGDPYNRLRYYTKIGWLPHMQRKKNDEETSITTGHYPKWALNRLIQIETLKKKGLSNDEIAKKISTLNRLLNIQNVILSPEFRTKLIVYSSFLILIFIFLNELEIINLGRPKSQIVGSVQQEVPSQIIDSGQSFVPAGSQKIRVLTDKAQINSKVYINFEQDYSPATRYWVSEKIPFEGFILELDSPIINNTSFQWWLTN
ncbi:hypothetical protein A3F07_04480 [candidate division WWE3 bacterium RIFCSPHIGHO2_12_FULL_38_15]|uniref:HTH merR-type domain-containing protein n=1 Tax=candidate division WWE3 bacterium RIFCSPHIGHO2_02_FULL_38_14 TaxID=1802620 RepID=A0A1F4VDB9_UNCKA|nr:MAG: hypothetical protein A2793_01270 [candidate division WWE3 bacterium RIFCSPHIGHO2_01_FULL_38_45]OGC49007.1 MAG: hypothetical protein A3F07_04480 [candidate division WWE3 bacterium RIFCSPHIGHO2_12_FULL_38_15]OGC54618.1 MAG: hypothetical protein A3B64_03095 [candidate division WWE3 bacterium RIFCSPLOWO2_01_FULL_37_24]OGC54673.1 MAG: hypothetical protein A3D91_03630 [candidate division WWE3 bacterium RIFCSPHIGHO2_02_FULL_38_14]HLB51359.1 MerR family transcriptional regulator [Patescibacteri